MNRVLLTLKFYKAHIFSTIAIAGIVLIIIALNIRSSEPDKFSSGVVTGFRLVEEGKLGTVTMGFVRLQNSRTVVVRMTPLLRCRVGSTVSVREVHSLLGSHYDLSPFQCLTDNWHNPLHPDPSP